MRGISGLLFIDLTMFMWIPLLSLNQPCRAHASDAITEPVKFQYVNLGRVTTTIATFTLHSNSNNLEKYKNNTTTVTTCFSSI